MADSLTQLQDGLDNLLQLMHDSLNYIHTRHPYGEIPGQPSQAPEAVSDSELNNADGALTNGTAAQNAQQDRPPTPPPATPDGFNRKLREYAQKIVMQQQQVEYIIERLPGITHSEADQEREMRRLEGQLRQAEEERAKAEEEREKMIDLLGQVIVGAKRVP